MWAIEHPFTLNPNGQVYFTTSPSKIYLDKVLNLLTTNIGQRPLMLDYGTDLGKALFENEYAFAPAVTSAINEAIAKWIPEVSVESVVIGDIDINGQVSVTVNLILPNDTSGYLILNSATFGSDGTIVG